MSYILLFVAAPSAGLLSTLAGGAVPGTFQMQLATDGTVMGEGLDETREMVIGRGRCRVVVNVWRDMPAADPCISLVGHSTPDYFIIKMMIPTQW